MAEYIVLSKRKSSKDAFSEFEAISYDTLQEAKRSYEFKKERPDVYSFAALTRILDHSTKVKKTVEATG